MLLPLYFRCFYDSWAVKTDRLHGKSFCSTKTEYFYGFGKKLYAISSVEWTDKKFYSMKILSKTCSCWQFQRFVAMINSPIFFCFFRVFFFVFWLYNTFFLSADVCVEFEFLACFYSTVLPSDTKKLITTKLIHITALRANLECIIESSSLNYSWKSA